MIFCKVVIVTGERRFGVCRRCLMDFVHQMIPGSGSGGLLSPSPRRRPQRPRCFFHSFPSFQSFTSLSLQAHATSWLWSKHSAFLIPSTLLHRPTPTSDQRPPNNNNMCGGAKWKREEVPDHKVRMSFSYVSSAQPG